MSIDSARFFKYIPEIFQSILFYLLPDLGSMENIGERERETPGFEVAQVKSLMSNDLTSVTSVTLIFTYVALSSFGAVFCIRILGFWL